MTTKTKESINICGILVHAKQGKEQGVETILNAMDGVDVHHITNDSRLVVTIELENRYLIMDTMSSFNDLPEVISTVLIYQHSEDV
jgi:nitrate reductase NapD